VLSAAAEAKIVRECCESAIRGLAKEKWRGRSASASGTAARLARRADVRGARRRRLRRDRVSESGSLRFDSVGCSTPPVGESPFRRARDDEERDESFAGERLARYRRHGRRLPGRVRASAACDSRRRSRKDRDISLRRRGTTRAFFETERLRDVNVNANAASADAENREIAVSESPRVRDIVRRLSLDSETPRTPETLLARVEALEAERDALRKSVEKLTRKKRRKHSRDDRVEDRVSSDAALPRTVVANERRDTNDASVGSSAYVDETRTKTTEDGRSTIATKEDENERVGASRRGILISALTRLFGVSAFVAMAAALLLAAVDIFDIVDPAAPIGATEHSGRLTGSIDLNVDRLDRYWERDTGPTGRAARSMLKLPKEMFVRFVADAKNAVTSPWLSGHEEARENEGAFEYDDYPVPAPS
jgi:hypothetical protein